MADRDYTAEFDQIIRHFKLWFPSDPLGAHGKHFAKGSCSSCLGRGLATLTTPQSREVGSAPPPVETRFCGCAVRRMRKTMAEMRLRKKDFEGPRPRLAVTANYESVAFDPLPATPRQSDEASVVQVPHE